MAVKRFKLHLSHGDVFGIYHEAPASKALVLITVGLDGFCTYGMFPYIQSCLASKGISSIAYNFSHGGILDEQDIFSDLISYQQNCIQLERDDLHGLITQLGAEPLHIDVAGQKLILLSHSLGNYPAAFAAAQATKEGTLIQGMIFLAPSMTLDFWSEEQMRQWEQEGTLLRKNRRTGQMLPLGKAFLEETKDVATWDLKNALRNLPTKYLIIHGDADESIPLSESETIC